MARNEVEKLVRELRDAQHQATEDIMRTADFETLDYATPDGFSVKDTLQLWRHELRSHHRDLILARGRLINDNPHYHVPHFVRQANADFGQFVGELSCLADEQLDLRVPESGRSIREIAEHVLGTLSGYFANQIAQAREIAESDQENEGA